jgi:hypothetical protein
MALAQRKEVGRAGLAAQGAVQHGKASVSKCRLCVFSTPKAGSYWSTGCVVQRAGQPAFAAIILAKKDASSLALQLGCVHRHFKRLVFKPFATSFVEMSQNKGIKRIRTQEQVVVGALDTIQGREQLLVTAPELQTRLGRKFCDETELLPLLVAHGLVRRVRTILIEVRPLGGDSFKVTLDASLPTVGEAKAEIARSHGTAESHQELYKVAERADGMAVREDDAEPELLEDESTLLGDRDVVAMAVREPPLMWRTFPEDRVMLSEGGAVATQVHKRNWSLTTTEIELTEGTHYWEVELLSQNMVNMHIGISRPNLDPITAHLFSTDNWFIGAANGALYGNGKDCSTAAGGYKQGDRVGVLLDLNTSSLRFFKNGVPHGPGYPAGSITGAVVHAVQMMTLDARVRLLPNAPAPIIKPRGK